MPLGNQPCVNAMKITEALFAEHVVFHNLFDHIESTLPKLKTLAEVKTMASIMEAMLKGHSDTEDDLFIGPLEHCFEQIGQRDGFIEEHREIDGSLREVQEATRIDQARRRLLEAVRYSRVHFDKEERIVFPMAERLFKEETLQSLGKAWMNQRTRVSLSVPATV
jgi:hemerythrin-like domain-containing protein